MDPDLKDLVTEEEKDLLRKELVKIGHRIQSEKFNSELYLKKSAAELALGFKEQSIQTVKIALSLDGMNSLSWYYLGTAYQETRQYKLALDAYKKALECWEKQSNKKTNIDVVEYILKNLHILELLATTTENQK